MGNKEIFEEYSEWDWKYKETIPSLLEKIYNSTTK